MIAHAASRRLRRRITRTIGRISLISPPPMRRIEKVGVRPRCPAPRRCSNHGTAFLRHCCKPWEPNHRQRLMQGGEHGDETVLCCLHGVVHCCRHSGGSKPKSASHRATSRRVTDFAWRLDADSRDVVLPARNAPLQRPQDGGSPQGGIASHAARAASGRHEVVWSFQQPPDGVAHAIRRFLLTSVALQRLLSIPLGRPRTHAHRDRARSSVHAVTIRKDQHRASARTNTAPVCVVSRVIPCTFWVTPRTVGASPYRCSSFSVRLADGTVGMASQLNLGGARGVGVDGQHLAVQRRPCSRENLDRL